MARKTHDEFVKDLCELNPRIIITGQYIDSKTKVQAKCIVCGHEWLARPQNLRQGTGCPLCASNSKKTNEKFVEEMAELSPMVELISEYQNAQTKVKCRCRKCAHTWEAYPTNLLKGNACARCAGKYVRTAEEFLCELNEINPNVEVLGDYVDTNTNIKCRCLVCDTVWYPTPSGLFSGRGCPTCGRKKASSKLRRTHEEYVQALYEKNPSIIVLGRYINSQTKLECRCNVCSYTWEVVPQSLLQGTGCPSCSGKLTKTHEQFVSELEEISPTIEVLSKYKNAKTKLRCRCRTCGHRWDGVPTSLIKGASCAKCNGTYQRSRDEFVEELKKLAPTIEVIGEYVNTQTNVRCYCSVCNHEWTPKPSKLLQGQGCPECAAKKRGDALRKSHQQFVAEMYQVNPNITILGKYVAQNKNILCRCGVCGNEWSSLANNLLRGQGCPECGKRTIAEKLRKPHNVFVEELSSISPRIQLVGEYVSDKKKVKCKCEDCGHGWLAQPSNLLKGSGCPYCAHNQTSFVERAILLALRKIVGKDKVLTRDRATIGRELDIYIPIYNLAIEPGSWYWHKDKVKEDMEKQNLCQEKGIRLITIYDSFDGNRDELGFDDNVLTYSYNLGDIKYRDELRQLIQNLILKLGLNYVFTSKEIEKMFEEAKRDSSRKTTKSVIEELAQINPDIEMVGVYQDTKTKMPCRCKVCGNEWEVDYEHLIKRKHGCPKCNSKKKKVINLETGEIYESASEAARAVGATVNAVGMVCRGRAKTCKGARWAYVSSLSDEEKMRFGIEK